MDLVIGRDGKTGQLNVAVGQKMYRFFTPGSVPNDVSRQHCIVTVHENGSYTIRNIKTTNVTYVNGLEVERKSATMDDRIELGKGRYLLNLASILETVMPRKKEQATADISHLQKIWDEYNEQDQKLEKHQKIIAMLASVPMAFSMLGGVVTGMCESLRPYAIVFTAMALAVMAYGLFKRFTDDTPKRRQQLRLDFQQKYVCPNSECQRFLGSNPYSFLIKKGSCPYCKTKYNSPE